MREFGLSRLPYFLQHRVFFIIVAERPFAVGTCCHANEVWVLEVKSFAQSAHNLLLENVIDLLLIITVLLQLIKASQEPPQETHKTKVD